MRTLAGKATINDPKAYSKPWNIAAKAHLLPQDDPFE
jgi:hypothetical protein